ncbi:hypothetical protein JCGZ_25335 [Jatropha curcas]|uniref:DUF241 domain protein n=1 Tax=Jatropha curcas TaxID=180498 RepID=A0A067JYZ1_JATCU|nr:uncharacterized protein LOC105646433 [Jatropha curcas]KDP24734.1 hypothetical protein JCGZ_25335 [Jatropha curcas]
MANTTFFHNRSDSLPSRPHPLIAQLDDHISRLRISDAASTSSSTSIANKLTHLQDLHDCVDKLLLLPLTQQALLAHHQNRKCVDELLDGSLRLLDVCNAAKDALLQTKEYTLELESTIRRRQNGVEIEVKKYLTSRKMAKKSIQKALSNLKGLEKKCFSSSNGSDDIGKIISILKEVEVITLSVFKSFLSFVYGAPKGLFSKSSNWALVSKLMVHKRIASDEEEEEGVLDVNEFATADSALESFVGSKYDNNAENVQSHLKNLELCIQDLEEGTHSLFRRLIKTRVSLLNIFN